jgi:hypothetical protein
LNLEYNKLNSHQGHVQRRGLVQARFNLTDITAIADDDDSTSLPEELAAMKERKADIISVSASPHQWDSARQLACLTAPGRRPFEARQAARRIPDRKRASSTPYRCL